MRSSRFTVDELACILTHQRFFARNLSGTGISSSSARKAIKIGVSKIIIGHQLFRGGIKMASQTLCSSEAAKNAFLAIHTYSREDLEGIKKVAANKMDEFGSADPA